MEMHNPDVYSSSRIARFLKESIITRYGTIKAFCEEKKLSVSTISRALRGGKMTVRTFCRLMEKLGYLHCVNYDLKIFEKLTLEEYLEMYNMFYLSILPLNTMLTTTISMIIEGKTNE